MSLIQFKQLAPAKINIFIKLSKLKLSKKSLKTFHQEFNLCVLATLTRLLPAILCCSSSPPHSSPGSNLACLSPGPPA